MTNACYNELVNRKIGKELIILKFNQKLTVLRKEKGMNMTEFAKLLGTSKQVIARYERGENTPKITTVDKYAKILGVSLQYLINEDCTDRNGQKTSPEEQTLTEGEKILLELFRQIPEDQQKVFLEMGRLYAKSLKKE